MEMMERANWLSGYKAWESPNGLYRIEVENIDWSNRKVYFSFGRAFAFSGKLIVEKRFSAEMYLKYGISEIETFSMVFDYRGESFKGVSMERSKTIYLK